MAAKSFVVRIQTNQGTKRIEFFDSNKTFSDLQKEIQKLFSVSPEEMILSWDPPSSNPKFVEAASNDSFSKIGIKHGTMLYLVLGDNHVNKYKKDQEDEEKKLEQDPSTNSYLEDLQKRKKKEEKLLIQKKPKSVTLATSEWVNDPKQKIVDNGPKHIPFHEWIQDRQKKYSNQPWNIDPPKYDYKPIPYKNHVQFAELPPNAVIKRQEYRHVDVLQITDPAPYGKFKKEWEQDTSYQRAAYLIGNYEYVDNELTQEAKKSGKKLIQANVYALYVPPQVRLPTGVKLKKDPNEKLIDKVIEYCKMERVGLVITTLPREDKEKYQGEIFMSGNEIFTAARLQEKYKNLNTGFSKFVSLISHYGEKEARSFQISDQGVAMIRHGLISPDEDPGFMKVNVPPSKVYVPSVINENKEIKPGDTFLPDALLVDVIATVPKQTKIAFQLVHFPYEGSPEKLRQHLAYHKDKEYHNSLSDFNLLTYLSTFLNPQLLEKVCKAVITKQRLDQEAKNSLAVALSQHKGA